MLVHCPHGNLACDRQSGCDRRCDRGREAMSSRTLGVLVVGALLAVAVSVVTPAVATGPSASSSTADLSKIKHVVVIMQENRSFDSYFGTYPGADGIPMKNGMPTVVRPDRDDRQVRQAVRRSRRRQRRRPARPEQRHRRHQRRQDGRLRQTRRATRTKGCADPTNPACTNSTTPDVMGYHTQSDIPNYWSYAQQLRAAGPHVRTERVVEPARAPVQVSEWSALCTQHDNPSSCIERAAGDPACRPTSADARAHGAAAADPDLRVDRPDLPPPQAPGPVGLLRRRAAPSPTARTTPRVAARPCNRTPRTPGIWNPLPYFDTVRDDGQLGNIQSIDQLLQRGASKARCPRCRGSFPPARSANTRPRPSATGSPTSRA